MVETHLKKRSVFMKKVITSTRTTILMLAALQISIIYTHVLENQVTTKNERRWFKMWLLIVYTGQTRNEWRFAKGAEKCIWKV